MKAVHELTWLEKLDRTVVLMHCSMSASANIIAGFFPPSSNESFLQYGALRSVISLAVAVLPVNEINGTSGWDTNASPARGPVPKTMLTTPGGKPRGCNHVLNRNIYLIKMSCKMHAGNKRKLKLAMYPRKGELKNLSQIHTQIPHQLPLIADTSSRQWLKSFH